MYIKTVIKHRWYVFKFCVEMGIPFRGLVHDVSKFSYNEYKNYKKYFDNKCDKKYKKDFDYAWLHHIHRNKHHWNYWIIVDGFGLRPLEMPKVYVKEMVADFKAAGIAYQGFDDSLNFYKTNKDKMLLHDNTRKLLESYLGYNKENEIDLKIGDNITSIIDDNMQIFNCYIKSVDEHSIIIHDEYNFFYKYINKDRIKIVINFEKEYVCKVTSNANHIAVLEIL